MPACRSRNRTMASSGSICECAFMWSVSYVGLEFCGTPSGNLQRAIEECPLLTEYAEGEPGLSHQHRGADEDGKDAGAARGQSEREQDRERRFAPSAAQNDADEAEQRAPREARNSCVEAGQCANDERCANLASL